MPRNQELVDLGLTWTELTDGDATKFCFQVKSGTAELRTSVGPITPAAGDAGLFYHTNTGQSALASIFDAIGLAGANRVWARASGSQACTILVTHD